MHKSAVKLNDVSHDFNCRVELIGLHPYYDSVPMFDAVRPNKKNTCV